MHTLKDTQIIWYVVIFILKFSSDSLIFTSMGNFKGSYIFWRFLLVWRFFPQGVNFCPGQEIFGVTTHNQTDHTPQPLLFHIGRDPGEKYPIRYIDSMQFMGLWEYFTWQL